MAPFQDIYVPAKDGLKLRVREFGSHAADAPVVVCLPGLSRNGYDFYPLAEILCRDPQKPHRVICVDYRGRGFSEWDNDWTHYNPFTELDDLQHVLAHLSIAKATFVGTSRGGLLIMGLAAIAPDLIKAAVLNDIGPSLEAKGLARIHNYLESMPTPKTLDEAVAILTKAQGKDFPALRQSDWEFLAQGTWHEQEGQWTLAYDPAISKTLEGVDLSSLSAPLWAMFDHLKSTPMLVVRGANSDMLTSETLSAMQASHSGLEAVTIAGQGHAPLMSHPDVHQPIVRFITDLHSDN